MASTGLTQKQRLDQWEAWMRDLQLAKRAVAARVYATYGRRQKGSFWHGFKRDKATDDREEKPRAGGEGEARAEAGEEGGKEAGGSRRAKR